MARRWIFMLLPCTPALSLSNKVDAASAEVLRYAYDATGLLTNRWTKAKGTTTYRYDALGQLTNVVYPVSPALTLQYDLLGRLTNLVDGFGQTRYSYANNRLASEDGPWAEDTVSYSYQYAGPRSGLTLLQPNASPWTQSYGYDAAERLTSVASPGGAFGYAYDSTRVALPGTLTLPNGATIATSYDFMARLTNTTLRSSQSAVLNHHGYGYNAASQRTSVTNLAGNTVAYRYDRSGQLTQASGKEANGTTRLNEQFGYGYDDENQLITVIVTNGVNNSTLSRFAYDGFGRRRVRTECVWQNGGWATNALVRYVYDGMVVLQERDGNNLPTVTYTRGRDLSSSLQGAGGIGGLLALTLHSSLPTPHFFYHADGNGNVTCLINEKQAVVARYVYEPFGNVLSMSGSLADLNLYRFSSKEAHPVSGLVHYGFRFYDPNLQRWVNRDPAGNRSGANAYLALLNGPLDALDPDGQFALALPLLIWLGEWAGVGAIAGDIVIIGAGAGLGWGYSWLLPFPDSSHFIPPMPGNSRYNAPPYSVISPAPINPVTCQNVPRGFWPADRGAAEWGKRTGLGAREGRSRFHTVKQRCKGSKATEKYRVNPETGEVLDPEGEVVGDLNEAPPK